MFRPILHPSDIHSAEIILNPLHHQKNYSSLETLLQLTKTSIGPHGKLKAIQNIAGGHVSVTSASSRLFQLLSIKNTFLKFIVASVNSHLSFCENGGLTCSLITLLLLKQSLDLNLHNSLLAKFNRVFSKLFINLLQSPDNCCVFNVSLTKTSHLYCMVYSIIASKPGCLLTEANEKDLTLLLLKAFLTSLPNRRGENVMSSIFLHTEEGLNPSESKLLDGVLLQCPETASELCLQRCLNVANSHKVIKVALFSTSLAGDVNFPSVTYVESNISVWDHVLTHLQSIANKIIENEVDILFCQKVVHPFVKKKLQDHCILVVDRLGIETTQHVQLASGAISVSSLSDAANIVYGSFTSFEIFNMGKKKYFVLQNTARPLWTVLLYNVNEEAVAEMKVVCQQAINTLYRLLKDPRVCCGAGCTEIYTAHLLQKMVYEQLPELSAELDCSSSQLLQALGNFISCIQDFAVFLHQGSKLSFATETLYGHLWESKDTNFSARTLRCKCGKHVSNHVYSSQWRFLQNSIINHDNVTNFLESELCEGEPEVIDELSMKINALTVSFATSSSLLEIGLLITPPNHAISFKQ